MFKQQVSTKNAHKGRVPVANACHSTYSRGRDQTWQIVRETLPRKNPAQK
jgi:hypothetical protein